MEDCHGARQGSGLQNPPYSGLVRIDIGVALHVLNARFLASLFAFFIDICCKEIVHITLFFC